MNSELTYQEVLEVAENFYQTLEPIFCPAINENISFTKSDGFHHIIHKSKGNQREQMEQMMRFKIA